MTFQKGHGGFRKHYMERVPNTCGHCGSITMRRPCEARRFCSVKCRGLAQRKTVSRTCEHCSKSFETPSWTEIRFCSPDCGNASRRNRFSDVWASVERHGPDECWPYIGGRNKPGYGKFPIDGGTMQAHRAAFLANGGKIPNGHFVLHRCDNPPCCNPAHLFAGTAKENTADMIAKGRHRSPLRAARRAPSLAQ